MEAYALARPVIGADIGGIPELIRVGETGAVFPSGECRGLAERLRRFAAMSASISWHGHAGRAWVTQDFTAARYRERLLRLYRGMGVKV